MIKDKLERAQEKILNDTYLAFAILGIPMLGSSLIRAMQIGWSFLFTWHIVFATLLWVVYLLRNYMALNVKVFTLIILDLITGVYGAWEWGLQGAWQIVIVAAPILITIFYGRYYGLILLSIVACLLSLVAYAYMSKSFNRIETDAIVNNSIFFWTNTIVTLLLLISPLIISIGKVQQLFKQNIVELTEKTSALEGAQNEISTTFEVIPIPIFVFNNKNEVVRINNSFVKLFGFSMKDLGTISDWFEKAFPDMETRSDAIVRWDNRCKESHDRQQVLEPEVYHVSDKNGKVHEIEIFFKAYDGKFMAVFNDMSLKLNNHNELLKSESNYRIQNDELMNLNQQLMQTNDKVTEMNQKLLRAKSKAEESDHHKTLFMQNMSHEIRTPLNAIIGFTEMLNDTELDEQQRNSFLDIVSTSSNQLLDVVNDIISVSSIESGKTVAIEEPFNINELLNSLSPMYEQKAKEARLKFSIHLALADNEAFVLIDSKKLKQVIINLLNNAFKYTTKGAVSIGYNLRSEFIVFYVKDSGIGIKQKYHQTIFDRFSKGDDMLARQYSGTGLGLSISKSFVEMMGGKIWLVSEEKKGATFFFTIPCKPYENMDS